MTALARKAGYEGIGYEGIGYEGIGYEGIESRCAGKRPVFGESRREGNFGEKRLAPAVRKSTLEASRSARPLPTDDVDAPVDVLPPRLIPTRSFSLGPLVMRMIGQVSTRFGLVPPVVGTLAAWFAWAACFHVAASAADWPMFRYDAGRSAASPDRLPDELHHQWTRVGSERVQAWDDPLNLDLMTYDRVFEPVVMDGRLFVGDSERDSLSAVDIEDGRELWTFFTDAPVRLAPVAWQGMVFVTSDDGFLYCLDAETGTLRWRFRGGASARKLIGNRRLVSAWPARGGAVIRDGKVYFAASIWPFMGTFIYALDARSGEIVWVNDSAGSSYIKQPHSAPSFAGVAPQGSLVATENDLIVPGGRSVPAVFDRQSGELRYFELNAGGKGTGGSFVIANDDAFFVHTRRKGVREFKLADGTKTSFQPNEPVLHGELAYSAESDKQGAPAVRAYDEQREVVWEVAADGQGDLIMAGDRLYAAGKEGITAIQLPAETDSGEPSTPRVVGNWQVEGQVERLLAAGDRLFAVTLEGDLLAFGAESVSEPRTMDDQPSTLTAPTGATEVADRLLESGDADGYALWYGAADEPLVTAVADRSPFVQLAVVDTDRERVDRFRKRLDEAGRYGSVTVHQATPREFDAAPYLAKMVFVDQAQSPGLVRDLETLRSVYQSVRPYGGLLHLVAREEVRQSIADRVTAAGLEQANVEIGPDGVIVTRVGALPGAANWTHQNGDIANTRKSNDSRVKLPLGILWFGGTSNMDVLPRHGHGPPQQVVDGRLFVQGIDLLSARDVYTGRLLWQREFDDLGTFDVYFDATYKDTPLETAYNQVHIPGSNARGTNFVVTADRLYLVEGAVCHVLDPATGESLGEIELPQEDPENPQEWGYLGVYDDVLIGGLGFARYRDRLGLSFEEEDSELRRNKAGFGSKSLDRAGSLALVGFDRKTGEQLWRIDSRHSFWNNGVVAGNGRIYALDKNPRPVDAKLRRRGRSVPEDYRIVCLDARTGETQWQVEDGIFGTWLGYSADHDLLLQAGAAASDRLSVEADRGMTVYDGKDGSVKWSQPDLKYSGPCILHNDLIITNANSYRESAGAFDLATGEPHLITNPLTGEQEHWKLKRAYGCNTILASENMLTFRSGAAGFYDLTNHSGTGNFGGFKSGCTANLIAAGGVLNAPDYTRTCSCAYQNQTSLAMVHMPEIETWTVNHQAEMAADGRPIEQLGINFAAPGHRRSSEGVLWIEAPTVAGERSPVEVEIHRSPRQFARHSSVFPDSQYAWVFASGLEGEVDVQMATTLGKGDDSDAGDPAESTEPVEYRIRLFFGLPEVGTSPGARSFDVMLDDETVLSDVTLRDGETSIQEVSPRPLDATVRIRLVGKQGTPVLSGVELRRVR